MSFKHLLFILIITSAQANEALKIINNDKMNEQEQALDETYIHQGLADEKVKELCLKGKAGYDDICTEDTKGFKPGSMFEKLETMIPFVNTAMAAFGVSSGFSAHVHKDGVAQYVNEQGNSVPAGAEGAKPKTEEKRDYCAMIAMVAEAASKAFASDSNSVSAANYKSAKPEAKQAAAFRATADSHKNLAKGAKIQFGVWTGTAGCYAAYMAQPQFQSDPMVYVKMGWATFMAAFYKMKNTAHTKRSKLLKQMANELPQAGTCSPYSDRSCFCSEESSHAADPANFNKYCVPQEVADRNENNDASYCADKDGKVDKECECKKNNTCIDRILQTAGVNLGLNPTTLRDPLSSLKPISRGFGTNGIDTSANRNLAIAKKALKKFEPKENIKLNDKQKEVAKALYKNGIPKAAAILAASKSKPTTNSNLGSSLASISPRGFNFPRKSSANQVKRASFKKGKDIRKPRTARTNPFARRKRKTAKTKAVHIEDFATKAQREAEINKDTQRGLFDIISYRYRMKALQKGFE